MHVMHTSLPCDLTACTPSSWVVCVLAFGGIGQSSSSKICVPSCPLASVEMVTDTESREVLIGPDPPDTKSPAARKRWQMIWPMNKVWDCVQHLQRKTSHDPPTHVSNHLAGQPPMVYVCDGQTGEGQIIEAETSLTVLMDKHVRRENAKIAAEESKCVSPQSDTLSSPSVFNGLRGKRKRVSFEEAHSVAAVIDVKNGAPSGKVEQRPTANDSIVEESESLPMEERQRWLVPWYWQCLVLSHRAIKQSRPTILSKLNFLQVGHCIQVHGLVRSGSPHCVNTDLLYRLLLLL